MSLPIRTSFKKLLITLTIGWISVGLLAAGCTNSEGPKEKNEADRSYSVETDSGLREVLVFEGADPIVVLLDKDGPRGISIPASEGGTAFASVNIDKDYTDSAEADEAFLKIAYLDRAGDESGQAKLAFSAKIFGNTDTGVLWAGPDYDTSVAYASCAVAGCGGGGGTNSCRLNSACRACFDALKKLYACMSRCRRCNPRTFCTDDYNWMKAVCSGTQSLSGGLILPQ